MDKEELKNMLKEHVSIQITEEGNMCSDWLCIEVLFDDEVIIEADGPHKSHDD